MEFHMQNEIATQGEAWADALKVLASQREHLAALLQEHRQREIRFIGAGSSYCAAQAISLYWGRQGFQTRAIQPSEQIFHADAYPFELPPLAIALTRSGSTTEVNQALRLLKERGCTCIAITTTRGSAVEEIVDHAICVPMAREDGIVQTRSFTTMLLTGQALSHTIDSSTETFRPLTEQTKAWLKRSQDIISPLVSSFKRVYVLGTGEHWALAAESALLLKETALVETEAFETFDFRHGPQSMIDKDTLLVCYTTSSNLEGQSSVLQEFVELGAQVLAVGKDAAKLEVECLTLAVDTPLSDPQVTALLLLPVQLLAYEQCLAKNMNPDQPRHLQFAIELKKLNQKV